MDISAMKLNLVQFLCVLWTRDCCFGNIPYSLPHYTVASSSGPLTNILLDDIGNVFVSGKNVLLKFTPDLVLNENIPTRGAMNCSESTCEDNFASIFLLYPYQQNSHILFCGTVDFGSCSLFNASKLNDVVSLVNYEQRASDHYLGSQTSALAVVVPVLIYGRNKTQIFSAMDYDGRDKEMFPSVFSVRSIYDDLNEITYASDSTRYITLKDDFFNKSLFDFKYGFHYREYTYFLRNQKDRTPHAHISEVCSNDHRYRSYVESKLSCGGYALIDSAYLLDDGGDTAVLYVAFSSSKHRGSVLCYYSMDDLRQAFRRIESDCFYRGIGAAPDWAVAGPQDACQKIQPPETDFTCGRQHINPRIKAVSPIEIHRLGEDNGIMTSIVATKENYTTAFYCGFKDGILKKFVKVNSHIMTLYTIQVTKGRRINDKMVINPFNKHLYFTYSNTVSLLRTDNCSLHSSCGGCLSDTMSCLWCPDSTSGGHCLATSQTCDESRSTYCDAEIQAVAPLVGPVAGGTLLTLDGIFGDPSVSVYLIYVGHECILNTTSQNRLTCVTSGAADLGDVGIELHVTYTGSDDIPRPTPIYGLTMFGSRFLYREPRIIKIAPTRLSSNGRPIMIITGENLDIGGEHHCNVDGHVCDILG